jgi:hypothetical protein
MKRQAVVPPSKEFTQQVICRFLSIDKNQQPLIRVLIVPLPENLQQSQEFGIFIVHLYILRDFGGHDAPTTHGDFQRFS